MAPLLEPLSSTLDKEAQGPQGEREKGVLPSWKAGGTGMFPNTSLPPSSPLPSAYHRLGLLRGPATLYPWPLSSHL